MSTHNQTPASFAALNLSPVLLETLQEIDYQVPSPIQEKTIPVLLEGKDVIAQAQTGTGKTAAFALPLLDKLNSVINAPQILILAPTRELALQVSDNIMLYSKKMKNIKVASLCGGQDYRSQLKQLKSGAQIVVGTPGRVMDHMRRGSLVLDALKAFVLDEADEMLRMGFIEDVEWILGELPKKRQMALFSATMPQRIRAIATQFLTEPQTIIIKSKTATVSKISQRFLFASLAQKNDALLRILSVEQTQGVIVFVRTKSLSEEISRFLLSNGFKAKAIHGDITQKLRISAVEDLKSEQIDILVATDVAARGLDIERISHVINYDIPFDAETYVHRIGRTGRAGRSGQAILFVTPKEGRMLNAIERTTKQKIEKIQVPSDIEVQKAQNARLKDQIKDIISKNKKSHYQAIIQELIDENEHSALEIAAAIASIAWKEPRIKLKSNMQNKKNKELSEKSKNKHKFSNNLKQVLYRLEVGHKHGAKPGNIVGAIANEAGLDGKFINDLEIFDDYSTVALPEGMPKAIFKDLKNTWVCGKKLQLSLC
jgi:ATP-dependent RNA helicase DeaD